MICIKNLIEYYYNIRIKKIDKCNDYYILHGESNNTYRLYSFKSTNKVNTQLSITSFVDYFYIPLFNKFNNIYFIYNNNYYVLFKYNKSSFSEFFLFNNKLLLNGTCVLDWKKNWMIKSDYIYNFFNTNMINNEDIICSVDYFLGLTEYAISLLDDYYGYYGRCSICYICYDNDDFCNPLNTKIDLYERNLAEYLRMMFYNSSYNFNFIDSVLRNSSNYSDFNLVLARMIYPSNYFYSLEEYFLNSNTELITKIISMVNLYEKYIMDVYEIMCKYQDIKKISFT